MTDEISDLFNDPEKVREAIQSGIHKALQEHKRMGNPICETQDGEVVWIEPEDIPF